MWVGNRGAILFFFLFSLFSFAIFFFPFLCRTGRENMGLTREGGKNKIFTFSQKSSSFFHIWCFWCKEYLIQFIWGVEMLKKKRMFFFPA